MKELSRANGNVWDKSCLIFICKGFINLFVNIFDSKSIIEYN